MEVRRKTLLIKFAAQSAERGGQANEVPEGSIMSWETPDVEKESNKEKMRLKHLN